MLMPEPAYSPFAASLPTYSPHPAMQHPVCHISVGSQTGHSSNLTLSRSKDNSDDTGALPSLMLYRLPTWAFTLVDLPMLHQFVGGHVACRPAACIVSVSTLIQKLLRTMLPLLITYSQDLNLYLIPAVHCCPPFKSTLDHLLELDSLAGIGITLCELSALLSHCKCGRVMTKCSFLSHGCSTLEVIDLTLDD